MARRISNELYGDALPFASHVNVIDLTAGVAQTISGIANANCVRISTTAGVLYVRHGGTAAVPSAAVADGTGSDQIQNGELRRLEPGESISVDGTVNCKITVSYFTG